MRDYEQILNLQLKQRNGHLNYINFGGLETSILSK